MPCHLPRPVCVECMDWIVPILFQDGTNITNTTRCAYATDPNTLSLYRTASHKRAIFVDCRASSNLYLKTNKRAKWSKQRTKLVLATANRSLVHCVAQSCFCRLYQFLCCGLSCMPVCVYTFGCRLNSFVQGAVYAHQCSGALIFNPFDLRSQFNWTARLSLEVSHWILQLGVRVWAYAKLCVSVTFVLHSLCRRLAFSFVCPFLTSYHCASITQPVEYRIRTASLGSLSSSLTRVYAWSSVLFQASEIEFSRSRFHHSVYVVWPKKFPRRRRQNNRNTI